MAVEIQQAAGTPAALPGATAATRYVGGTTSGAPASGTFSVGDFVNDQTGQVWICVTAGSPGTWTCATKSRSQLRQTAAGVLDETFHPQIVASATTPTSQHLYAFLLGLHAGDVVTGVMLRNIVAAAGTNPTTVRFGIADSTGKILAVSGNSGTGGTNNATTLFPLGPCPVPFASPYTVLADGGYYACFVVNGTWGTTAPTPIRGTASNAAQAAVAGFAVPSVEWNGQTDLPAVNSSITLTTASGFGYYAAFY